MYPVITYLSQGKSFQISKLLPIQYLIINQHLTYSLTYIINTLQTMFNDYTMQWLIKKYRSHKVTEPLKYTLPIQHLLCVIHISSVV